jgi:hypothetical protein
VRADFRSSPLPAESQSHTTPQEADYALILLPLRPNVASSTDACPSCTEMRWLQYGSAADLNNLCLCWKHVHIFVINMRLLSLVCFVQSSKLFISPLHTTKPCIVSNVPFSAAAFSRPVSLRLHCQRDAGEYSIHIYPADGSY